MIKNKRTATAAWRVFESHWWHNGKHRYDIEWNWQEQTNKFVNKNGYLIWVAKS